MVESVYNLAPGLELAMSREHRLCGTAGILIIPHRPQAAVDEIQVAVTVPVDQLAVIVAVVVLAAIPALDRIAVFQHQRRASN